MNTAQRLIACILAAVLLAGCTRHHEPTQRNIIAKYGLSAPPATAKPTIARPIVPIPTWITVPAIRAPYQGIGEVLSDIDSHMPAGHTYRDDSDLIGWAHETTHGLNSSIRESHGGTGNVNAFYVLKDRAAVLPEPHSTTIMEVAKYVPRLLRGQNTYDLYMVGKAAMDWNDRPLYIIDELSAYTNGSNCGLDLAYRGLWDTNEHARGAGSIQNMLEFQTYAVVLAWVVKNRCPEYDDIPLKTFLMWEIYRGRQLSKYADKSSPNFASAAHGEYCKELATGAESENLRKFIRAYFGTKWAKAALDF